VQFILQFRATRCQSDTADRPNSGAQYAVRERINAMAAMGCDFFTHSPTLPKQAALCHTEQGFHFGECAWWRHGNTTQCTTSDEGHGRAPKKGSRVGRLDLKLDVLIREHGPAKVASRRDVVISLVVWDINNSNCWLAVDSTRAAGLGGVVCLVLLHGLLYFQLYGLCVRRRAGDVIFVHLVTVFASGACVSGEMVRVCVRV
jgi:hypothetical protein